MFNRKKPQVLTFEFKPEDKPEDKIVLLDVDDTLILGKDSSGESIPTYNRELIDALALSGVKEVHLLSSMSIGRVSPTMKIKEEKMDKSRLDLIHELDKNKIKVVSVMSDCDLVSYIQTKSAGQPPGYYYREVIRPCEERVQTVPGVDLRADKDFPLYMEQYKQYMEVGVREIGQLEEKGNIKGMLATHFFDYTKVQCEKENKPVPKCIMLDDDRKGLNLIAVAEAAESKHVNLQTLKVEKQLKIQDYLLVISPSVAFQNMLSDGYKAIFRLRSEMNNALSGLFSSFSDSSKKTILEPMDKILQAYVDIEIEMKKGNFKLKDCIDACSALYNRMNSLIEEYKKKDTAREFDKNESTQAMAACVKIAPLRFEVEKTRNALVASMPKTLAATPKPG